MLFTKKKMKSRTPYKWQRILQWGFMADVWKYILMRPNVSQVPVLNTKEANVMYVKLRHG